ncbi:MAG: sulfotransferase family protein [Elusimicrobiota bacterium]
MENPIFIVGMPRSGTSLLSYILSSHSKIIIAPETHFITKFYSKFKKDIQFVNKTILIKRIKKYFNSNEISDLGFTEFEKDFVLRRVIEKKLSGKDFFKLILRNYAKKQNKNEAIWGEKTPAHLIYIETINEWFPCASFIHVVRDPRDVSLSLQRVPWDNDNVYKHAKRWMKYLRLVEKYKKNKNIHIKEIKYENLLLETEKIVKGICNHVNLAFDKHMLQYYKKFNSSIELRRKPWKKKNRCPIDKNNYNKWIDEMSLHKVKIIETVAGQEMKNRGYKLSSEVVNQPKLKTSIETIKANFLLKYYQMKEIGRKIKEFKLRQIK